MKSKLQIILMLLLIFALDGVVLAEKANSGEAAFTPDGIGVSQTQRRRRRRRRARAKRPKSYHVVMMPDEGAAAPEPAAPPAPAQAPVQQEIPATSAPPPPPAASDPMDAPGRGRPAKKAGPTRIKPPTVQIKPPTR